MERSTSFPSSPVIRLPTTDSYRRSTPIEVQPGEYVMEQDKNKYVVETVRPVDSRDSDPEPNQHLNDPTWQAGFINRFPALGFCALFTVLLCAVGSVLVLGFSNHKSQTDWPKKIAPNVILSGLNSLSSICFSIAIGNGIAIAWWRQTLKGATIEQLHKSWSFSTSLKEAALAGKYFNVIALAALTTKLTIIDGILMQRATTTYVATDSSRNTTISGFANLTIPITGRTADRSGTPGLMTQDFSNDLKAWATSPVSLPAWGWNGCDGICFVNVAAAGFEFDCEDPVMQPIRYGSETQNAEARAGNGTLKGTNLQTSETVFSLSFGEQYSGLSEETGEPLGHANLTMDVLYTQAHDTNGDCPGTLYKQSCVLRPAVVNYPLYITDDSSSMTSSPTMQIGYSWEMWTGEENSTQAYDKTVKQQTGFEVLRYLDVHDSHVFAAAPYSQLAGLAEGFTMFLGGFASFNWGGFTGWQIDQRGAAPQYLMNAPEQQHCGYLYTNPMNPDPAANVQSVVAAINEIMFSLATNMGRLAGESAAGGNMSAMPDGWSNYTGIVLHPAVHYQTESPWMIGAICSMLVCVVLVLPTYWGYWQLGRKVTLGPFEIAHAFRSPMTAQATNGTVDDVMTEVGHREVKFGHIVSGDAKGVVGIAEPEHVARMHPSVRSAKEEISEKVFGRATTH